MKSSTKVAIGIFVAIGVYLVYKMFSGYSQNNPMAVTASNLSQPTSDKTSLESPNVMVPTPATGPVFSTRSGRGHF